jgi:hypothetical protein
MQPDHAEARRPPLRLLIVLTLWPALAGALGNLLLIALSPDSGWDDPHAWVVAAHLGAVAMSPGIALANIVGFRLVRAGRRWAALALMPMLALPGTLGGVLLHYYLLSALEISVYTPPIWGTLLVPAFATAVVALSAKERR